MISSLDSEIWSEENYVEVECVFVALNGYTQAARIEEKTLE